MQKKTKFKSPLRDALVILVCLLVALLFVFLFWRDLNNSSTRTDKDAIATISFKNKIAQRKFEDRVVWERVSQNAPLYDGDIIRTADLSQAVIHFNDGTTLDLSENTMIQIYYSAENGLEIAVGGGDIQVDSSAESNVALKLDDGSVVTVDAGASLAAKSDASGAKSVEVKSGSAQITTESGATADLAFGDSVSVEKGGEIQKKPLTVTSIPKDLRILNIKNEAVPVTIAWKTNDDTSAPVVVQTAKTRDFSQLELNRTVSASSTELRLEGGVVYWRVFAEDAQDMPAEGKITVENIAAVQSVAPADASEYRYRAVQPRINFRWSGNEYVDHYRLVVSSTPDMRGDPVVLETQDSFVSMDSLGAGTYYWQVTPFYTLNNIGYEGASVVRAFSVIKNDQIRPPELSAPAANAQLTYRTTASAQFVWKSELKDADYQLLLAKDAAFTDVVFQTETKDLRVLQEFDLNTMRDGTYYWKIVRRSADPEDFTPESEVRSFTLARYIPQENKLLYPPENFSAEQAKLAATQFLWKLGDDYNGASGVHAKSVLQISAQENFSTVQDEFALESSSFASMLLAEGTYYWRVGAQLDDGTREGFTAARRFTVLRELDIPQLVSPAPHAEVLTSGSSPVTFTWNAVAGADYYNVRIFTEKEVLVAQNPSVTATTASFTLPPDSYTCRVQAVAAESETAAMRSSAASPLAFSVREPAAVVQHEPAAAARIAGLTALRTPTVFSWQSGKDKAASYELVLSKVQSDGSAKVVERVNTGTRETASFDRLTEGSYTWQIVASTASGFPVNSETRRFTVEQVPELPRAKLVAPRAKLVMDSEYLRKNRTITFNWEAVTGATEYNFVLYKKGARNSLQPVFTERGVKGTSVRLRDLSVLDIGEFTWNVTAFCYAKDGYEEQRGKVASQDFKISFDEPQKVQTIAPGRMYGE